MKYNEYIIPEFILRILSDPNKHWMENRVSFVYLANEFEESIVNFHHNDALKCSEINDLFLLDTFYTFPQIIDPRAIGGDVDLLSSNFRNAELAFWFKTGRRLDIHPDRTITQYWDMRIDAINDSVPIMRWIEYCRSVRDVVSGLVVDLPAFDVYEEFLVNLRLIEKNGLYAL